MSMEVSSNYNDYKNDYLERVNEGRALEAEKGQEETDKKIPVQKDEYISSEKSGSRTGGLYRMGQDKNGNPKVMYDNPKKCTTNTNKVDMEIEKLKEQKQQLEQQIRAASGDEEKIKELENKLSRIEEKLSQKDNDTYRRQHAVIS